MPADPPPTRRLVVCLDGTWNSTYVQRLRSDGHAVLKPSNVLKLCRSVVSRDASGCEQIAYYDTGVGSLALYPGASNRLLSWADKALGGGWGAGFESNIDDALAFLAVNYRKGDEVFLFGFSRGAATARGLTRFIDWAGGLPARHDAYYLPRLFRRFVISRGQASVVDEIAQINAERQAERRPLPPIDPLQPVTIRFLGVWDTVMALGSRFRASGTSTSIVSRSFYIDAAPAACVTHARQALAIDEARFDFRPEIWQRSASHQSLEQRWFAGVHSNVGGGYVDDGLANLAFHWILKEAVAQGLDVDRQFTAHFRGFAQDKIYPSASLVYRVLDRLRRRSRQGQRSLSGHPASANLSLDVSVIHRLQSDPTEKKKNGSEELRFPDFGEPYRPENLLAHLALQADVAQYLASLGLDEQRRQLPADVLAKIESLRKQAPRA